MKCAYDYGGGVIDTRRFVLFKNNSGDLEYYHKYWGWEVETKGVEPYKRIGNNLYYQKDKDGLLENGLLSYINFETAKHHQIMLFSYLKNANELPAINFNSEVLPGIPVYIWECERLD